MYDTLARPLKEPGNNRRGYCLETLANNRYKESVFLGQIQVKIKHFLAN
jgi:hypothetical protein